MPNRSSYLDGYFWYLAPFAICKNSHFDHAATLDGEGLIPLPFEELVQTDQDELLSERVEKDQLLLPPDEWKEMLACFECGLVDNYDADDVDTLIVPKPLEGVYHSDGVCICVEARCAKENCRAPAKWYVDITGATENDLLQRLRKDGFFGTLPCGHEIRTTLDKSSFRTYRTMNRLWPRS